MSLCLLGYLWIHTKTVRVYRLDPCMPPAPRSKTKKWARGVSVMRTYPKKEGLKSGARKNKTMRIMLSQCERKGYRGSKVGRVSRNKREEVMAEKVRTSAILEKRRQIFLYLENGDCRSSKERRATFLLVSALQHTSHVWSVCEWRIEKIPVLSLDN